MFQSIRQHTIDIDRALCASCHRHESAERVNM